jgi:hypothetical protein
MLSAVDKITPFEIPSNISGRNYKQVFRAAYDEWLNICIALETFIFSKEFGLICISVIFGSILVEKFLSASNTRFIASIDTLELLNERLPEINAFLNDLKI